MTKELYQFAIRGFLEENSELFIKRLAILCEKSEHAEKVFEPYLIHVVVQDDEAFRNVVQSVVDECYKEYAPRPDIEIIKVGSPQNHGVIARYKYVNQNGEEESDAIFVDIDKLGKIVECSYV